MSQETYTFACPVCAVRLSVPKALAGVRGPCPQCHHDITAPEPASVLAPAMAGAGEPAAPARPASAGTEALYGGKPIPPPDSGPLPPPPASVPRPGAPARESRPPELEPSPAAPAAAALAEHRHPGATGGLSSPAPPPMPAPPPVTPPPPVAMAVPAPEPLVAVPIPAPVDDSEPMAAEVTPGASASPVQPRPAVPARRSRLKLAVAFLLALGLAVAAGLNLLPRESLRVWLGRAAPSKTHEAAIVPRPAVPSPTPAPAPEPASPAAQLPAPADPTPPPIEVRPALTPGDAPEPSAAGAAVPEAAGPSEADAHSGGAPDVSPEGAEAAVAPDPATSGTPAEAVPSVTPPAPAPKRPTEASLLPDISSGAPAAAEAIDESRAGAQEALTLFLQARTWKERLALSHGGDSLAAEMEAYYRTAKDGPNPPTSMEYIASAPLPGGSRTVQIFHVTFTDLPQGFPVPVNQTEEGWKIDWQAFVEFRESRLKKFLALYQDPPAVFRVLLQRAHYRDPGVPKLDEKYVFRVAAPIDGHVGYVFVDKDDSIVVPKLENKLEYGGPYYVMVKLKWVRGTNGRNYVELRDLVSESWRGPA